MQMNFNSSEYRQYLEGCYQNPIILLEISSICNFKCVYCISRLKIREKTFMSKDLFEHIVKQIPGITNYPLRLHIDGEPTLHPRFYEYGMLLNDLNIPFILATNGSRLSSKLLDINMDMLISISSSADELRLRMPSLDYNVYIKKIVAYLQDWLKSDSKQNITLQIPFYSEKNKVIQSIKKHLFSKHIMKELNIKNHIIRSQMANTMTYHKNNGNSLVFHKWAVQSSQVFRPPQSAEPKVHNGFCSSPWEEIAILADGRVSFCCRDLTGGTAYTSKKEIWVRPLLEIWMDKRIASIRNHFFDNKVQLPVCQRCLVSFHNYELHLNEHPCEIGLHPKNVDLFPVDSLGKPRLKDTRNSKQ